MQTYTILTVIAISYLSMGYFEVRNISTILTNFTKHKKPHYITEVSIVNKGTSKNPSRHAELVSASPCFQEIADQARNDMCAKNRVFDCCKAQNNCICLIDTYIRIKLP